MNDRRLNRLIRRIGWLVPVAALPMLQVGGCTGVQDLQGAVLSGTIQSVSNGVFSTAQTLFLNIFRV